MTFAGIDLAAEADRTGLAIISEVGSSCVIERVHVGVDDDAIVAEVLAAEYVGVDVPLGWPVGFVALVAAHTNGTLPRPESTGREWRRGLAMRTTDLVVHRRTGITPLSVSTDRIARAAMRWAGIEARLRDAGVPVARDDSDRIFEVYPAAALKCWSMVNRGYKGSANLIRRSELWAHCRRSSRGWTGTGTATGASPMTTHSMPFWPHWSSARLHPADVSLRPNTCAMSLAEKDGSGFLARVTPGGHDATCRRRRRRRRRRPSPRAGSRPRR